MTYEERNELEKALLNVRRDYIDHDDTDPYEMGVCSGLDKALEVLRKINPCDGPADKSPAPAIKAARELIEHETWHVEDSSDLEAVLSALPTVDQVERWKKRSEIVDLLEQTRNVCIQAPSLSLVWTSHLSGPLAEALADCSGGES